MLLLWATGSSRSSVFDTRNQHRGATAWKKYEHRRKMSVSTNKRAMSEETQAKWTARLWWKQHCSGFGSFAFFHFSLQVSSFALLIFVQRKTSKSSNTYRKLLEFSWERCEEEVKKKLIGNDYEISQFFAFKNWKWNFFGSICWLQLKFLFSHFYFFLSSITGFLSTLHPTENPIPPMHKEPAMHDPASESQSLPVLSTKKVHCRWHESGR